MGDDYLEVVTFTTAGYTGVVTAIVREKAQEYAKYYRRYYPSVKVMSHKELCDLLEREKEERIYGLQRC